MDFEHYARHQRGPLLRFAVTLTGDPRLAEELVQDVLLRAFQRWAHIGELDRPHAYVRRMVVNEHLSWRRRWSRVEPRAEIDTGSVPDETGTRDDRATLVAEIVRLPRKQRAVLAMRYFEDLPDAEIAEALGCSSATVRSIAARALTKLRVQLSSPATSTDTPTRAPKETVR